MGIRVDTTDQSEEGTFIGTYVFIYHLRVMLDYIKWVEASKLAPLNRFKPSSKIFY